MYPLHMFSVRGAASAAGGDASVDNLLLLSVLIATIVVPATTARIPSARRALGWTLLLFLAFTLVYVVLVTQVYTRHYAPEPFYP
jgi:hypothetical protein